MGSCPTWKGGAEMTQAPFTITFPGASAAEANQYAGDLGSALRAVDRGKRAS